MAVVANVQRILAIELLVAAQALDLRLSLCAEAGLAVRPGTGVADAQTRVRRVVSHLDRDRLQAPDIEAAVALIREGALVDLVAEEH
jgi:histidine ammonia-lyase